MKDVTEIIPEPHKIKKLKSQLITVGFALLLGLGISVTHHAFHQTPSQAGDGLIDRAITVCGNVF